MLCVPAILLLRQALMLQSLAFHPRINLLHKHTPCHDG
jgi:hypothetical protein